MTDKKQKTSDKTASKDSKFQDEFKELPLEEKVKVLLRMEALTLQETFNYGLNESMKAADRLGEVLADFGKKIESEFHNETRSQSASAGAGSGKKKPPKNSGSV